MERVLDIHDLMGNLAKRKVTAEELIDRALRNLYTVDCFLSLEQNIKLRNNIRSTIAYIKLLYDYEQQMDLDRDGLRWT